MPDEPRGFKYDIALSFAGEDRDIVEHFASILRDRGIKVFYDAWEAAKLWGKDLYQYLDDLYCKKARYCIDFSSNSYARKAWTRHELRSAQAPAFRENTEYILPVRLDGTEIPGIPETVAYIDLQRISVEQLADLVLAKLSGSEPIVANAQQLYANQSRLPRTAEEDHLDDARVNLAVAKLSGDERTVLTSFIDVRPDGILEVSIHGARNMPKHLQEENAGLLPIRNEMARTQVTKCCPSVD